LCREAVGPHLDIPSAVYRYCATMAGWIEQQGDRGKRILCLLMCFGGGIFLATYLLHMGPEVRQDDKTSSYISIIQ